MEKFIVAGGTAIRISDTGNHTGESRGTGPGFSGVAPSGESGRIVSSGPARNTVVLLHGYLENLDVWDDFSKLLAPHARVVALDLPGHGISEVKGPVHSMEFLADTVYAALIELNVEKCTVVGHSMGGYVALALAASHPEMLDGLVLFSSTPNADTPEKRDAREREIAIVESGKKELLSRILPGKGFAPENRTKFADEIEDLAELTMITEDDGIVALLRGMAARSDQNAMLDAQRVPVLFIFGRHDEYISVEAASNVAARHPEARVEWLDASGHNGFIEEPRISAQYILDFIKDNSDKNQ